MLIQSHLVSPFLETNHFSGIRTRTFRENNHGSPVPKTTLRLQNTTSGSLRRRIIDKDKTGRTAGGPDKWNFSDTRLHHPLNGNA